MLRELYYRTYQWILKLIIAVLNWDNPVLIEGENSVLQIPNILEQHHITRVMLVTGKVINALGLSKPLQQGLEAARIDCAVFSESVPDPTIDVVEAGLAFYHENHCQAVIAFGGGSPMDVAKLVCARVARPGKTVTQMRGILKIMKATPLLIAVPTTAGTGSETTIAAMIVDGKTKEKYSILDYHLMPKYAVLDPLLTTGLSPQTTAYTGLDALTHAVEAYVGRSNTAETRAFVREAVKLIFDNLYRAYTNGTDVPARAAMLKASYDAGRAFTKAFVGYVHALSHSLGGYYGVSHGLANAVILPCVLDYYGEAAYRPLAELADLIGAASPGAREEERAKAFIARVRDLEASLGIPTKIDCIQDADLPGMLRNALREANPMYPVPRTLDANDLRRLFELIR